MQPLKNWKRARTAGEALEIILEHSESVSDQGLHFEELFTLVARIAGELEVRDIYRLSEWPDASKYGLDGQDIGVDRVAILATGERVAIQCKCYKEGNKVSKADIQSFLAGSQNNAFDLRWIVTTSGFSGTATKILENTNIRHIDFHQFSECEIGNKQTRLQRNPNAKQQEAIAAVVDGFESSDNNGRGQLLMACGTGKTFTALRIAEQIVPAGGKILFIAPSIALVAQARREWLQHTNRLLSCVIVCSDKSVSHNEDVSIQELYFSVTTSSEKIANALRQDATDSQGVTVIFSTYQSLDKIVTVHKRPDIPNFDLAIVDEAHKTAGVQHKDAATRQFQLIHHQDQVRCNKRLYMTATPRIYETKAKAKKLMQAPDMAITDMSDSKIFGPRFYRLTFRQAVDANLLCDIRVICLGLTEDVMTTKVANELKRIGEATPGRGKPPEFQEFLSALVIGLALRGWIEGKSLEVPSKLSRTLAYANTTRRSKWLAAVLNEQKFQKFVEEQRLGQSANQLQNEMNRPAIEAIHLDASHSAYERNQQLRNLNSADIDSVSRVVANCRLFTEGVDVPALSSVAFMDPKSSTTDIIQAVGRVMRKAGKDKQLGYVIAPFTLPAGQSVSDTLQNDPSRFAILFKVLQALQSHDEELYSKLSDVVVIDGCGPVDTKWRDGSGDGGENPDRSAKQLELQLGDLEGVYAQIANYSGLGNIGKLVADILIVHVRRAARIFLDEDVAEALAEALGASTDFLASLSEKELKSKFEEAANTASLVICNACLMHKRIEATGNLGTLQSLEKMGRKENTIALLLENWKVILQKDYKPIFEQAFQMLEILNSDTHKSKIELQSAIHILINCAVDTGESLNELGYDHAGPLYHRVLDHAKSQGAFYTKNLSALLMGKLVFNDALLDWSDQKQVKKLRIMDPCCGTGTLLMASLNTIKDRALAAQEAGGDKNKLQKNIQALHKALVEKSIHGLDITSQAIQLAACNLTLGEPSVSYDRINLYTLEYGMTGESGEPKQENVRQGALELFNQMEFEEPGSQIVLHMGNLIIPVRGRDVSDRSSELKLPKKYDVVVMNPPFTDTSRQKNQFPQAVGKAMSERLKQIAKQLQNQSPEAHEALAKMSIGPFFTPLSDQLIDKDSGTLAKFIPTTAVTAHNGVNERIYLARNFHIETIVTSHDPKNIAFSASTSIHESLLIARRKADKSRPTKFIQLARMPADTKEVNELSDAINTNQLGDWGNCILWPSDKIQAGNWSPAQWYSEELVKANQIIEGLGGLVISGSRYRWSPGDREFRGLFDYEAKKANSAGQKNAYCSIAEKFRQSMASAPDTGATPKTNKKIKAELLLSKGGHVLIPCRISTTSARLFAIYSETPALGAAYRPIDNCETIGPNRAKAYTVFMNSSFGILQLLNRRAKTLTYPAYETGHMKTLLLPSSADLDIQPLIDLFMQCQSEELLRISCANIDPVRKSLDHAVAKVLGVDPAMTDKWRELLAKEPTVRN